MGHRRDETLQVGEIRRILQLLHDLHALPPAGVGRRRRMLQGLCDLLDADAAESAILQPPPHATNGEFTLSSPVLVAANGRRPASLLRKPGHPHPLNPALSTLLAATRPGGPAVVTRTRRQLVPDRDWYPSDFVQRLPRTVGHDDAVYSARRLDPRSPTFAVLCLTRARGSRRPMGRREALITQLLHSEVAWIYDAPAPTTLANHLTPRQRECLEFLLNGRSEKQIATDLRLSPHTVHVHVKALYRNFSVSTRAELMARLLTAPESLRSARPPHP